MKSLGDFLDEVKVYDILNLTKIRIGNQNDGGYIVAKELGERIEYVYSFGIGDDVGFEKDFFAKFSQVKRIHLFDPNIDFNPTGIFTFEKKRFNQVFTSENLMDIPPFSLLKMDIEWDEWDGLLNIGSNILTKFDQLIIEFHIAHIAPAQAWTDYFRNMYVYMADKVNNCLFEKYFHAMERLNDSFHCFHIHANNSLPKVCLKGALFPPLIELSFVRKDNEVLDMHRSDPVLTTAKFPVSGLDFPNKPDRPDIENPYPLRRELFP